MPIDYQLFPANSTFTYRLNVSCKFKFRKHSAIDATKATRIPSNHRFILIYSGKFGFFSLTVPVLDDNVSSYRPIKTLWQNISLSNKSKYEVS